MRFTNRIKLNNNSSAIFYIAYTFRKIFDPHHRVVILNLDISLEYIPKIVSSPNLLWNILIYYVSFTTLKKATLWFLCIEKCLAHSGWSINIGETNDLIYAPLLFFYKKNYKTTKLTTWNKYLMVILQKKIYKMQLAVQRPNFLFAKQKQNDYNNCIRRQAML